eukprot:CAMPEP_0194273542 /NCGR_PEP_ID=MMETSP0169-20130528/6862_1 /TAXON_ID=218684 /ORGANISM="Corethron pennatum, Strain L29A3" /LENGTH=277 /DNA_ID=CAMNT_0039016527 /DNA_START=86 /DNA_END=919 /DNA_ORIENTATION=+
MDEDSTRRMNDSTMPPSRIRPSARMLPVALQSSWLGAAPPRKKVGVTRGFGLADWNLLKRKSRDLSQRCGRDAKNDVTTAELWSHRTMHDGWIALRGRVYNITPYLHYHPGGVKIFKGLLGTDCTDQFDRYHPWVNIDGLVANLYIANLASKRPFAAGGRGSAVVPPVENIIPRTFVRKDDRRERPAGSDDFLFVSPAPRPPKNFSPLLGPPEPRPPNLLRPPSSTDGLGNDNGVDRDLFDLPTPRPSKQLPSLLGPISSTGGLNDDNDDDRDPLGL